MTISPATLVPGDTLSFTSPAGSGITGSYTGGVLTLAGTATPAQYQAALQSVAFSNTVNNTAQVRSLTFTVDDGGLTSSATEQVDVAVTPPVVTPSGAINSYVVGGAAVAVDPGVAVGQTDIDLSGATASISSGTLQAGDTLSFTSPADSGITGSYDSGTGSLTLSGSATPGQYQAALQSLIFSTTSSSTVTRSISITAQDGTLDSTAATEQIPIALPQVTPSGATSTFYVGGVAVPVDADLTATYLGADLTAATVAISPGILQSGDTLSFTSPAGSNITGSYSGGVLTLSGTSTVGNYEMALESVTFASTSNSLITRDISIVATDGAVDSDAVTESVDVAVATPALGPAFQTSQPFANSGIGPVEGNLTLVGSKLYGTTEFGPSVGPGSIFSMNPDGSDVTILHSFTGTGGDGGEPRAGLLLVGSTLYGTTVSGGADGDGTIFAINTDGTGYRVLYSFTGSGGDGSEPFAALTLAGSTLYGTTVSGGTSDDGTIFSIGTNGAGISGAPFFHGHQQRRLGTVRRLDARRFDLVWHERVRRLRRPRYDFFHQYGRQ